MTATTLAAGAGLPPGVPGGSGEATAATAPISSRETLTHHLGGVLPGDGPAEAFSSPAVADITGDGVGDIISATMDGFVIAYQGPEFSVLWERWLGFTAIQSSPAVAQLRGSAEPEVVVGTMDGRVVVLDGASGDLVRTFHQGPPQFCRDGVDCRSDGFFATPALADITGDGRPEIIAPSYDHSLYVWQASGQLVFRRFLHDTLWSSPTVADIDRNGRPDIVLGGDIYPDNPLGVPAGGLVWVLQANGATFPGYPKSIPDQTVWSTPAVADLEGDGNLDIVTGTGVHGPYGDSAVDRRVYAFRARDRATLPGFPITAPGRVMGGPVVADLDGDERNEVAFASEGGYVQVHEHDGTRKWIACDAYAASACGSGYPTHGSVTAADVDDDGTIEVVSALDKHLRIYDARTGAREASRALSGDTLAPAAPPTIAEIDGRTTIVQQAIRLDGSDGQVGADDTSRIHVFRTPTPWCQPVWPHFKRDASRTGSPDRVTWTPFDCPRPFITRQYADFLGRQPDAPGIAYWATRMLEGDWGGPRVIQAFMDSPEFGALRAPLVRGVTTITGLPPRDSAVFADLAARRQSGEPIASLFSQLATDPDLEDSSGESVAAKAASEFVGDAYRYALRRDPTGDERSQQEEALTRKGRGRWLADFISGSSVAGAMRARVYVSMSYLGMLGRVPDLGGYDFWVDAVERGRSIKGLIAGFQVSAEYAAITR